MFSKEEDLKKINLAYQRIVISAGKYETDEFGNAINKATVEDGRRCIAEFIKNHKGDSLFVNYETMLQYYEFKEALHIILCDMEDTEKNYFLYLYVPQEKEDIIKATFDQIYEYRKEWITELYDRYEEDNFVIKLDDKRSYRCFNYFKVYPDGKVYIFIDSDFEVNRKTFCLEDGLKKELISEVKKKVNNILKNKKYFVCDDREFSRMFALTYGIEWLGINVDSEWGIDNKDYFLDKYPLRIIEKIMNLPTIKEIFINAKHD